MQQDILQQDILQQEEQLNLIQLPAEYYFDNNSKIGLRDGFIEISKEKFIAVGFEKTKVAKEWQDIDYFNIIIVTKADDQQYYFRKIEHSAEIFSPKYVNDDIRINWIEKNKKSAAQKLISNLYCLVDSRSEYTLNIDNKAYFVYEKNLTHTISVSYEIWEDYDKNKVRASPFLRVRCQLLSKYLVDNLDYLPMKILEYPINIYSLFQTSVFQYRPFEIWYGNLTVDGIKVTLESK